VSDITTRLILEIYVLHRWLLEQATRRWWSVQATAATVQIDDGVDRDREGESMQYWVSEW